VKTIGLLGGMSWESSVLYEQIINQEVRARLGGVHSASLLIRSYDFARIERLQAADDWEQAGQLLAADAARLQDAGAQILVLATNTMHQVYDQIAAAVSIPFPHIADATGTAIRAAGLSRIGLLGTRFTMGRGFYRDRLAATHHLEVLVPAEADRALVHQVIYSELVQGMISDASRQHYLEIIRRLTEQGAEGVIAGCTEIELLVTGDDTGLPYFPTTRLHAQAAVDLALARHADLPLWHAPVRVAISGTNVPNGVLPGRCSVAFVAVNAEEAEDWN
jgi:aspartate racemase